MARSIVPSSVLKGAPSKLRLGGGLHGAQTPEQFPPLRADGRRGNRTAVDGSAPFLTDINSCNLQQVTWVVPDGRWGDHSKQNTSYGPDWVADIVNSVGGKDANGNVLNNCGYWANTVVLITWDDWGAGTTT